MNKLTLIIAVIACATSLAFGVVLSQQSREIEQIRSTRPASPTLTDEELDKRVSTLENFHYWQEPLPAFVKSFITNSFTIGFNDHIQRIEKAREYFIDDEAYQEYLDVLQKWNVPGTLVENQEVLTSGKLERPLNCSSMQTEIYQPDAPDIICIIPLKLNFQSGAKKRLLQETIIFSGKYGGELYKISNIVAINSNESERPLNYLEARKILRSAD